MFDGPLNPTAEAIVVHQLRWIRSAVRGWQRRHGRCLVVLQVDHLAGAKRAGLTPLTHLDVLHVMALGAPEEAAVSLLTVVEEADPLSESVVLVTERYPAAAWYQVFTVSFSGGTAQMQPSGSLQGPARLV